MLHVFPDLFTARYSPKRLPGIDFVFLCQRLKPFIRRTVPTASSSEKVRRPFVFMQTERSRCHRTIGRLCVSSPFLGRLTPVYYLSCSVHNYCLGSGIYTALNQLA